MLQEASSWAILCAIVVLELMAWCIGFVMGYYKGGKE